MKVKKNILIISIVLLLCLAIGYVAYDNNTVKHISYTVSSEKIPAEFDGTKIALITDFHDSKNHEKVLDAVRDSSPDFICIAGDLISMNTTNFANVKSFIKKLTSISTVYYAYGNHEYYNATYLNAEEPVVEKVLNGLDVIFMNNRMIQIKKGGASIKLIGYKDSVHGDEDDAYIYHSTPFLEKAANSIESDTYSILMLHRGQYFDEISKYPFDLVLSGHLHGGDINLPIIKDKILDKRFHGHKYAKGVYHENNSTMVLSGGCASGNHIRILNTPEVVTVVLEKE